MAHGIFGLGFLLFMIFKYGFALIPGILVAVFVGYSVISNAPGISFKK